MSWIREEAVRDAIMPKMSASTRETEIKLAFASPGAALAALSGLGARPGRPRTLEKNRVYDLPGEPLARTGCLLRLREAGGRATLTFKAPVPGEHRHKVREEHETDVGDAEACARILEGLGYRVAWRYEKYRTTFELRDGLVAAVDDTPIGCWLELEGEASAIDRAAAALGFGPEAYVRGTYRDLLESDAAARGVAPGDLLFDDAP